VSAPDPAGPELVLGLVAPVGVSLSEVADELKTALLAVSYTVKDVNVINAAAALSILGWTLNRTNSYDGIISDRMDFGNQVRSDIGLDGLALIAIEQIHQLRREHHAQFPPDEGGAKPIPRTAYLIRSLKTEDEVRRLREVYGGSCYIVAAYASRDVQLDTLSKKIGKSRLAGFENFRSEAERLIKRDERERGVAYGQNVRDTFPMADVFLDAGPGRLKASVSRFVEILFSHPFRTPSRHELGMFLAHGASLRSASPGRQVGACIASDGDCIAIGTNEVPRYGGGEYWEGDKVDWRDHQRSSDSTTLLTQSLLADLLARLRAKRWLNDELAGLEIEALLKRTASDALLDRQVPTGDDPISLSERALLRDIVEFMRAVHAEMAAITSAARRGVSVKGCTMYVTAFPCHECAKHIVSSGIREVYFVDPYPKSRVSEMFDDSIAVDREAADRVPFQAFTGIAPRFYEEAFQMPKRRDGDGWVNWEACRATQVPRRSVSPNMYLEKEDEALRLLRKRLPEVAAKEKEVHMSESPLMATINAAAERFDKRPRYRASDAARAELESAAQDRAKQHADPATVVEEK
jgi:deoxycytidylate deaminase